MRSYFLTLAIYFLSLFFGFSQDLIQELGRMYSNLDSGQFYLEEAKQKLNTPTDSGIYYFYVAEYQNLTNNTQESRRLFLEALPSYTEEIPSLQSITYIRLTRMDQFSGLFDQALDFAQQGFDFAQSIADTGYMAYHLADISVIHHDMENYALGVEYGKRALEILKASQDPNPFYQSISLNSIGINFDDWGKPDSALKYHFQVLDLMDELDSSRVFFVWNNIGNTLLKQKKYQEAEKWIQIAKGLNFKDRPNSYGLATNYTNLATIAYNQNQWERARIMLDSAKYFVEKSESVEKERDYLYEEYRFRKAKGELSSAIDYLEQYAALKDTIFKEERIKTIGELEAIYEVEQKERQLAESRARLAENELLVESRNNQVLLLILFLLISLGLGFFIFYRQKNKTRHLEQEAKLQAIFAEQQTQHRLQEQRSRISSDLHDNIGAQLTFIVSTLRNLKYTDLSKEKIAEKLDQISDFTVDTVNELRDTIWAMNKETIDMEDLQTRLYGLIEKANKACPDTSFDLEIDPKIELEGLSLNSMEGINYYRIIQEAVNNAIKHSAAKEIKILITSEGKRLLVIIKDNGKGMSGEKSLGNGISNMKVRAERIGRDLRVLTSPDQGTEISII
ncbi:tetratricopeptide repeat-containing sensor histidine kinase [Algoriphagus hitonicola]|uniref:Signal transduction histidine kinase n=1 Tax=Algoriphagus hitonicola TaxID=435880 RepID=A0A1I2QYC6_9BACT|nr:sensor histidine kinase [Algoriphagus hitonicola]SFG30696.1 Signal transduction histidine kinase [Algoriphagus hitonicola]